MFYYRKEGNLAVNHQWRVYECDFLEIYNKKREVSVLIYSVTPIHLVFWFLFVELLPQIYNCL